MHEAEFFQHSPALISATNQILLEKSRCAGGRNFSTRAAGRGAAETPLENYRDHGSLLIRSADRTLEIHALRVPRFDRSPVSPDSPRGFPGSGLWIRAMCSDLA
jgi:hypothetical protein